MVFAARFFLPLGQLFFFSNLKEHLQQSAEHLGAFPDDDLHAIPFFPE